MSYYYLGWVGEVQEVRTEKEASTIAFGDETHTWEEVLEYACDCNEEGNYNAYLAIEVGDDGRIRTQNMWRTKGDAR